MRPYRFVGSWAIFSFNQSPFLLLLSPSNFIWMMCRFRFAIVYSPPFPIRVWDYPSKQFFVFRGKGFPKPKIRKWVLTCCACYRNPTLVFSLY